MDALWFSLISIWILHATASIRGAGASLPVRCCMYRKQPDPRYGMENRWFPQMDDPSCECQNLNILKNVANEESRLEVTSTSAEGLLGCVNPQPLGMQFGGILMSYITASHAGRRAEKRKHARLNSAAAWCPLDVDTSQWIQVQFLESYTTTVIGLITQGKNDSDIWTESYQIMYLHSGQWGFVTDGEGNPKMFEGNTDNDSQVTVYFSSPIQADAIQIRPMTWKERICLRFELLGCQICTDHPLGMENGDIPDQSLEVSQKGYYGIGDDEGGYGYGKHKARLNSDAAWCPVPTDTKQWIRVDLNTVSTVKGLITQGRHLSDVWTKSYKVKYSKDNVDWEFVSDRHGNSIEFQGNTDSDSYAITNFEAPLQTRYIQIIPMTWQRYICIRLELLGC